MPDVVYNEFLRAHAAGEVDFDSDDFRIVLAMENTTLDTENLTIVSLSDFTLIDECDGANYVRKECINEVVTKDDPNYRAEFSFDPVTWLTLGNGSRQLKGFLLYKHVTDDSDSLPVCYKEFDTPINPGGFDMTITPNVEGFMQYRHKP